MTDSILRSYQSYSYTSLVPFPIPTATTLLDLISGVAVRAYSTRKLRAAYAGSAIRVRRSSDNAEQDIGFTGNDLDTTALATFVGANSAFVTTFYDQSTAADNVVQATAGSQPRIVNAGTLDVRNTKAAPYFTGKVMNSTSAVTTVVEASVVCANDGASFSDYNGILTGPTGTNPNTGLLGDSGTGNLFTSGGGNPYLTADRCFINNVNTVAFPQNGDMNHISGVNSVLGLSFDNCQIGQDRANAGRDWVGWFGEAIIWAATLSAGDRTTIYQDVQSYWGTA